MSCMDSMKSLASTLRDMDGSIGEIPFRHGLGTRHEGFDLLTIRVQEMLHQITTADFWWQCNEALQGHELRRCITCTFHLINNKLPGDMSAMSPFALSPLYH